MAKKRQTIEEGNMIRVKNSIAAPATDELKELTEQWMQLERKTFEQRKKAALFYDEYLMKLIEEEYIRNNKDMIFEEVEYMIVSVGTSYEPIVLNIQLLKPKKILFLYTEKSHSVERRILSGTSDTVIEDVAA